MVCTSIQEFRFLIKRYKNSERSVFNSQEIENVSIISRPETTDEQVCVQAGLYSPSLIGKVVN